jgi:2,3-dihydroxybenzoate decarboxylase
MREGIRIVTLEEHFATADYRTGDGGAFQEGFAASVGARIADVEQIRLPEMDATGVDMQVLSLTTPGVQGESSLSAAVERAGRSNDALADVVERYPDRFRAFACLPTQGGRAAADELRRCVGEYGFLGVLVNGHTRGRYLDDVEYAPLWAALEELDVPLYLHPAFASTTPDVLSGYPELAGPVWGWGFETASHALRLVLGGVFDRHPSAQVVLGHMGEGLPFSLGRIDDRLGILDHGRQLAKPPSAYFRENVIVTTAGVESAVPLSATIAEVGVERVLFSIDYPYQSMTSATDFLFSVELDDPHDRAALASGNAERLLKIQ